MKWRLFHYKWRIKRWLDTWKYPEITKRNAYEHIPNKAGDFAEACSNCECVTRGRVTNPNAKNIISNYCNDCGKLNTMEGVVLRTKEKAE